MTKKATIRCTPHPPVKKPSRKKALIRSTAAPPLPRYVFVPRTSGSGKGDVGVRVCKYCHRSYYYTDLRKHERCCYGAILDKEELALIEDDEDDGKVSWLLGGAVECHAAGYAKQGLAHLNQEGDKKYKIVRPGPYTKRMISGGPIVHFNFKAKAIDSDLVETFFCQLRMGKFYDDRDDEIDVLTNLGPSSQLNSWDEASLEGCKYCPSAVHHPHHHCQRLLKGLRDEDVKWLYGENFVSAHYYADLILKEHQAKAKAKADLEAAAKARRDSKGLRPLSINLLLILVLG